MIIRSIQAEDIAKFQEIGTEEGAKLTLNLEKWIDAGRTKLNWCFVIEESGVFVGRVIYGIFEDQPHDIKIWQFKIDKKANDFMRAGTELLKGSVALLKEEGFKTAEYHLYSNLANEFEAYQEVLKSGGFDLTQEKMNFEATEIKRSDKSQRLTYKTLQEVGERAFVKAIEQVTENTLDRDDIDSIAQNGAEKAAQIYFDLLKEIEFNDTWWRLAYDSAGELVGLVVPQKFDDETGAINYIGVVPNKRGNGYVYELVESASELMLQDGVETLIADIDVLNHPLEKALTKLGYVNTRSLAIFKQVIS